MSDPESGMFLPPIEVAPHVPPVHSVNSGIPPAEMAQADSAAALAAIEPLGGPTPHDLSDDPARGGHPPARHVPPPAPEEIDPERDYHGRGPAYVGIAEHEREREQGGSPSAMPTLPAGPAAIGDLPPGRDFGFEAGRAAPLSVPAHEPLEPEDRVEAVDAPDKPGEGVVSRLRRALFG